MSQNTSRTRRPRPRATEASNMKTSTREKRGAKTKSGNTGPKKAETLERLRTPITKFRYKPPLTHPTWEEWLKERDEYGVRYRAGQEGKIGDVDWVSVEAYRPRDDSVLGFLLMPARYYPLWRRLLWGALWYETMWEIWEEEAKKTQKKQKKTKADKWVLVARRSAAMRAVWYRAFHCRIVRELLTNDIGTYSNDGAANRDLPLFIEFGVRDYRSWHFDSIDDLNEKERVFLTLDPAAPKNVKIFERGALAPFLTNPPLDNDWLGGEVPFPKPRAQFVADLLRYGPQGPTELLPLSSEEGIDHLDDVRLWESVDPECPFVSRNYVMFARGRGIDPVKNRRQYLKWLLERSRDEEFKDVNWDQEVRSLWMECDDWDMHFASSIDRFEAGEIELDECVYFLLGENPNADEDQPRDLSAEEAVIWDEVMSVLDQLEEPDSGFDIVQARKALGEILGDEYGTIINSLIDSTALDPGGEGMNGAEAIRTAAMNKWFQALGQDSDDDEQDANLDDDKQNADSDDGSPMSISSV